MQISSAARATGAVLSGDDAWFEGVSTDTRTLIGGELFCALRGATFDGHEYCAEARQKGASGVIVERVVDTPLPILIADDSRHALGRLAGAWRERYPIPLVGVTGSNGKTTVKEMIAAILRTNATVLATEGNLNNEIGVPSTLFRLNEDHDYAVVEMGASHLGEIEWLAAISKPLIGVITHCAPVHLEGFGSIERVAHAKGELYAGLAANGTAVINADDDFASYWSDIAGDRRVLRFGLTGPAEVVAENISNRGVGNGIHFTLRLPSSHIDIELPFDGTHNIANALAAAAAAYALGITAATIKFGLENARKLGGRLCVLDGLHGSRIIDDTYNANPASLTAAIDVLASVEGQKWVVLGNMGELGPLTTQFHRTAGANIRAAGIDRLYTVGELAEKATAAFGEGARNYTSIDELLGVLPGSLNADVTVLVKGSRLMRMERVIGALARVRQSC